MITDQLRMRWRSLREVLVGDEEAAEMRTLLSYRRDLVGEQARSITRLRALLLEVFPGLEAALDLTKDRGLLVLTKAAMPESMRRIGVCRLTRWLKEGGVRRARELAETVVAAAKAQRHRLPASEAKGALVSEMAAEVLRARNRIASVDVPASSSCSVRGRRPK